MTPRYPQNQADLVKLSNAELSIYRRRIQSNLQALDRADPPGSTLADVYLKKFLASVRSIIATLNNRVTSNQLLDFSYLLDFLSLAGQQSRLDLTTIILSIYEPFTGLVVNPEHPDFLPKNSPAPIPPDQIFGIFFQNQYLSRPKGPVPFILLPNYGDERAGKGGFFEEYLGVAHEVGHHIYRQVPCLREELQATVAKALLAQSQPQQRLWFHYLEETFADMIGILSMGAAFVFSQHVMILYSVSNLKNADGTIRDLDLGKLLVGYDKTHPIPLIRGEIGNYIYTQLVTQTPAVLLANGQPLTEVYLDNLKSEWQEVRNNATAQNTVATMQDPHKPKSAYLSDKWNSGGTLKIADTINGMHLVVDTLLDTPLKSLGGKKLREMYNFLEEEEQRIYEETGQHHYEDEGKFTEIGMVRLRTPASAIARFKGQMTNTGSLVT